VPKLHFSHLQRDPYSEEEREDEDKGLTQFGSGVSAGIAQTKGLLLGGLPALIQSAIGDDEDAYEYLEYYNQKMEEAADIGGDFQRLEDIDGVGDAVQWLTYTAGNAIPSIGASIAGGGVGGAVVQYGAKKFMKDKISGEVEKIAKETYRKKLRAELLDRRTQKARNFGQMGGAFLTSAGMNAGGTFAEIFEESGGVQDPAVALATGSAAGVLDTIVPFSILKKVLPDNLVSRAKDSIANRLLSNKGVVNRAFIEGVKTAGIEGATEAAQELLQASAVGMFNDPSEPYKTFGESFFDAFNNPDEQLRSQYINAFAAGMVGGGMFGSVAGARYKDPKDEMPKTAGELPPPSEVRTRGQAEEFELVTKLDEPSVDSPRAATDPDRAVKSTGRIIGGSSTDRGQSPSIRLRLDDYENEKIRKRGEAREAVQRVIPDDFYLGRLISQEQNDAAQEEAEQIKISYSPKIDELVGQTISYNDEEGILTRRNDGVFVLVGQDKNTVIESGESPRNDRSKNLAKLKYAKDLGLEKIDNTIDLPEKIVNYDPESNTFTHKQRKGVYEYLGAEIDEKTGKKTIKTVDISNPDKPQTRDFKSPSIVNAIEEQVSLAKNQALFAPSKVLLEDLPAIIQKEVINKREQNNQSIEEDAVTQEEVMSALQETPVEIRRSLEERTNSLFERKEKTVQEVQEFTSAEEWREFQGKTISAGEASLEDRQAALNDLAGQSVKHPNGDDVIDISSDGIDQVADRIAQAMRKNHAMLNKEYVFDAINTYLKTSGTILNNDKNAETVLEEVQHSFFDLIESGLPVEVVSYLESLSIHDDTLSGPLKNNTAAATGRGISFSSSLLGEAGLSKKGANGLRWVVAHESWHVLDKNLGISRDLPSFALEIEPSSEGVFINAGDVVAELYSNYKEGTDLGKVFAYPFNLLAEKTQNINTNLEEASRTVQQEILAELGALYLSNPRLLKSQAPTSYEVISTIRDNPSLGLGEQDATDQVGQTEVGAEGAGIQGEVRARPIGRSPEIQDSGGAGFDGRSGIEKEQVNTGLGVETATTDRDSDGRLVQPEVNTTLEPDQEPSLPDQEETQLPQEDLTEKDIDSAIENIEGTPATEETKEKASSALKTRRDFLRNLAYVSVVGASGHQVSRMAIDIANRKPVVRGRAQPISDHVLQPLPDTAYQALENNDLVSAIDAAVVGAPQDVVDLAAQIKTLLPDPDMYLARVSDSMSYALGTVHFGDIQKSGTGSRLTIFRAMNPDIATLLHESLHMVIASRYRTLSTAIPINYSKLGIDPPAGQEALDQWSRLWKEYGKKMKETHGYNTNNYPDNVAYSSPDEFFVRALTEPEFQKHLHSIDYKGKTFYERFKDWIKRYLFGSDTGVQPTWLDAALTGAQDILDSSAMDSPEFKYAYKIVSYQNRLEETAKEDIDTPSGIRGPSGRAFQGLPANDTVGGKDRVQTAIPNGTKLGKKYYVQGKPEDYSIGTERILTDTAPLPLKEKLKTAIEGYDFFSPSNPNLSAEETLEEFQKHMVDNLIWLHDQMDPKVREEAKQWYDGARKNVEIWAERYKIEPRQVAAVIANLSPQKDWFMNMSLAERMMDIYSYRQDFVADKEMNKAFSRIVLKDEKGKLIQISKLTNDKAKKAFRLHRDIWSSIKGKSLAEVEKVLSPENVNLGQSIWIRMYDEAKHSRKFRVMAPSGKIMGLSMGKEGPQNVAWGSFAEIMKGVKVLRDGSLESVSLSLGDAHKVRNFYNNIISPNSELGEVTIDTHAVAAATFKPLSAKGYEVSHAFGSTPPPETVGIPDGVKRAGAGSSIKIGSGGTYGIIADAYREAAEQLGLLPRQLQSITWEEIRVIFPASFKDEKGNNLGIINDIWKAYAAGDLSISEVREKAYEETGTKGNKPVWARRPDAGVDDKQGLGTYTRDVYSASLPRSISRGSDVRSRDDVNASARTARGDVDAPSGIRFPLGQKKSHEEAISDGTLMDGREPDGDFNLDAESRSEMWIRKIQDQYLVLKKFQKGAVDFLGLKELPDHMNAYQGETLHAGKIQEDHKDLEKNYAIPIGTLLRENEIEADDFGLYLMAKHARERNKRVAKINDRLKDGGSGLTNSQAEEILAEAQNDGSVIAKEEAAALVYKMLAENRNRMKKAGLVDEDTIDGWESSYQFYVPLKGLAATQNEDGEILPARGLGSGFNIKGAEVFRALGRTTKSDNPLLYALQDSSEKISRARRNEVGQRFLALARELEKSGSKQIQIYGEGNMPRGMGQKISSAGRVERPILSMGEVYTATRNAKVANQIQQDKRYLIVKENGKEVILDIKHDGLNRAMQNAGIENYDALVGLFGKATDAMQAFQNFRRNMLINWNPSWFLINPLRDLQTGLMFNLAEESKDGGITEGENLTGEIVKRYFPAWSAYIKNLRGKKSDTEYDAYYEEYVKTGAPTGITLTKDIEEQRKKLSAIMTDGPLTAKGKEYLQIVEDANQTSENVIRFATYVSARESGIRAEKAAVLAKDLTVNFNRKGELSAGLNLLYLFFNAAVQGTANIATALSGKTADGKFTKAQIAGGGIALLAYMVTQHNIMSSEEDDDGDPLYTDLNDYDHLMSWNFVLPDGKSFFQMPLPYGYGMIHTMGRLGAEYFHDLKDEGDVAAEITAAAAHHLLPPPLGFVGAVGTSDDLLEFGRRAASDVAPSIFEPILELGFNQNHFGAPIYIEDNPLLPPTPDSSRSKRSTSELYKELTQFANQFTRGSLYRSGGVDIPPDGLQYLQEYFLGGVGRFINRSVDLAAKYNSVAGKDVTASDWPIARYFHGEPSDYADKMDYYNNIREAQQIFTESSETDGGDASFKRRFGKVVELEKLYKDTQKRLRKLRKSKKLIEKEQNNPVKAYDQISKIEAQMQSLFDRFNKAYREANK